MPGSLLASANQTFGVANIPSSLAYFFSVGVRIDDLVTLRQSCAAWTNGQTLFLSAVQEMTFTAESLISTCLQFPISHA